MRARGSVNVNVDMQSGTGAGEALAERSAIGTTCHVSPPSSVAKRSGVEPFADAPFGSLRTHTESGSAALT